MSRDTAGTSARATSALRLLAPAVLLSAFLLLGWGIDELPGFFRNPARTCLIAVTFATYVAGTLLAIDFNPLRKGKAPGKRWPILLGASIIPILLAAVAFCDRRNILVFPNVQAVRWAGVVALALGESIRLAALQDLGRQYSMFLTIQDEHRLVRTGLYRWIRHPFYLGGLLTVPGMMLVFRSPVAALVFVASAIFVVARIRREEQLLCGQFPAEYPEYQRRSRRLLPFVN